MYARQKCQLNIRRFCQNSGTEGTGLNIPYNISLVTLKKTFAIKQ